MRIVDVYRSDADSGFALVAQDCIQIEHADVSRKSSAKSFTMADGSFCLYPAEMDSAEFTLNLECSGSQVSAISAAVRLGELYFAGMRVSSAASVTPTDCNNYLNGRTFNAFTGYLPETSNIQVKEIEAAADLYTLHIPMKLRLNSSGNYFLHSMPLVRTSGFSVLGTTESFAAYSYRKGVFCRKHVIFTNESQMSFSFSMTEEILGDDASAKLEKNSVTAYFWETMSFQNDCTVTLQNGRNDFIFSIQKGTAHKKFVLTFTVWKNPEVVS